MIDASIRLLLGYNPTYGPDVTLWHGAVPFALLWDEDCLSDGRISRQWGLA